MHQKIQSTLRFNVKGVSLTGATDMEFYFRQRGGTYLEYVPTAINENTVDVTIPYDDAMRLMTGEVQYQMALTTAKGTPLLSKWKTLPVDKCLKEAGYRGRAQH